MTHDPPDTTSLRWSAAPERAGSRPRAFLAGPFTALIDPATGLMPEGPIAELRRLEACVEAAGFDVFNAHRRESWGAELMTPDVCTRLDFEEIERADIVVALPGDPPSPGTHIELGWASALGRPIVLLLRPESTYGFLVIGLHTVGDVTTVVYDSSEAALADLDEVLRAFAGSARLAGI